MAAIPGGTPHRGVAALREHLPGSGSSSATEFIQFEAASRPALSGKAN